MKFSKRSRSNKKRPVHTRSRTKPTTGQLELTEVIYMFREKIEGGEGERVAATCTCGTWRTTEEANTITAVAREAKLHAVASGHQLRKHH